MKYIGIDIGDGESAVTVVAEHGALLPAVVTLGNVKSIRSIVGTLKEKPVIGDTVVLNHAVRDRSARFKSRFLFEDGAREDLSRFALGLRELLAEQLAGEDVRIALGCPAQWEPQDRARYAGIVGSAGFPNLYTVSESRAAFLYAHHCNELGLSPETLKRPTLVIDIGSSTLDYAYIVEGRERDVGVFGENRLGGGILDELILDLAVEQAADREKLRQIFRELPSWKHYCELIARKLKEEYFLHEAQWVDRSCSTIAPVYADLSAPMSVRIALNKADMDGLLDKKLPELKDRSFREALEDSLRRAREITKDAPPELLIVTGGASRMGFFQEACRKVFPQARFALCGEPEFSIARGLGIAARTDDLLNKFREKVAAYFDSGAIALEVERQLPHLLPEYVPAMCRILEKKAVFTAVMDYCGDATNTTQLTAYIADKIGGVMEDRAQMEEADQIVNHWIAGRLTGVQEKLDAICAEYRIDRADMSLVKIHAQVKLPQFKISPTMQLLAWLGQVPWIRERLSWLSGLDLLMTRRMRKMLTKQLSDPHGDFAKALCGKLVLQLQSQIDEQTRKVEIRID